MNVSVEVPLESLNCVDFDHLIIKIMKEYEKLNNLIDNNFFEEAMKQIEFIRKHYEDSPELVRCESSIFSLMCLAKEFKE